MPADTWEVTFSLFFPSSFSPFIYFRGVHPFFPFLRGGFGLLCAYAPRSGRRYALLVRVCSLATFTFAAFLAAITIGLGWNWFCAWMKPGVVFTVWRMTGREWNGRFEKLTRGGFSWHLWLFWWSCLIVEDNSCWWRITLLFFMSFLYWN